mgnify:CR=1 FL=1
MSKTPEHINAIIAELERLYPEGPDLCSLEYNKDYELLFSVRLAAQCTDERVNQVTPGLFSRFPTLEDLANADLSDFQHNVTSSQIRCPWGRQDRHTAAGRPGVLPPALPHGR